MGRHIFTIDPCRKWVTGPWTTGELFERTFQGSPVARYPDEAMFHAKVLAIERDKVFFRGKKVN
jgi:hypothetical protein